MMLKSSSAWTAVVIVAAVALLVGCDTTEASFQDAVDSGEPCSRLFEWRNELDPKSAEIPTINERLREVGCYSASSERTDLP